MAVCSYSTKAMAYIVMAQTPRMTLRAFNEVMAFTVMAYYMVMAYTALIQCPRICRVVCNCICRVMADGAKYNSSLYGYGLCSYASYNHGLYGYARCDCQMARERKWPSVRALKQGLTGGACDEEFVGVATKWAF